VHSFKYNFDASGQTVNSVVSQAITQYLLFIQALEGIYSILEISYLNLFNPVPGRFALQIREGQKHPGI